MDATVSFAAGALPRIIAAGVSRPAAPLVVPDYRLPSHEVDIITAGRLRARVDGEDFESGAGMVQTFQPGESYAARQEPDDAPLVCRWVKFAWPAGARGGAIALPRLLQPDARALSRCVAAFDALLEAHRGDPDDALGGAARLLALLATLARAGRSRIDPLIARALAAMERRYADDIGVAELAREAGLSEDHFIRRFRREVGEPPLRHLIGVRLREARRLLSGSQRVAVGDAARAVGFADPGHFARLFRRRFGVSPSDFRSRLDA